MPTTPESELEREAWLDEATRRGFPNARIPRSYGTVYHVNGLRTNIKFSQVVSNRARFSMGNSFLILHDVFVFICETHHHFYAIGRDKMNWLAKQTTLDSAYGVPEFNINVSSDKYYSGTCVFPIKEYRDNWNIFKC
jgi:hypothetical protein